MPDNSAGHRRSADCGATRARHESTRVPGKHRSPNQHDVRGSDSSAVSLPHRRPGRHRPRIPRPPMATCRSRHRVSERTPDTHRRCCGERWARPRHGVQPATELAGRCRLASLLVPCGAGSGPHQSEARRLDGVRGTNGVGRYSGDGTTVPMVPRAAVPVGGAQGRVVHERNRPRQ